MNFKPKTSFLSKLLKIYKTYNKNIQMDKDSAIDGSSELPQKYFPWASPNSFKEKLAFFCESAAG